MKKIALIEDHTMMSEAIKNTIGALIIGSEIRTYKDGNSFLDRPDHWQPDIIVSDLMMPGLSGMDLIKELIKRKEKTTQLIILSSSTDTNLVKTAMQLGISGFLSKNASVEELVDAIKAVGNGDVYVNQELSKKLIRNIFTQERLDVHLTPREKEVLQLVCSGRTMKEIAFQMDLSINTIQTFQKNILRKFDVRRTTDLVVAAINAGIYNPEKGDKDKL
jgi:DNA-binding NarL/FixJ family response regulator